MKKKYFNKKGIIKSINKIENYNIIYKKLIFKLRINNKKHIK